MRLIGLTSVLVGLWVVNTCSAALPNGAHNLEEDQQQSIKPTSGNRLFNRAIRGPQVNAPVPRLNAQAKSQAAPHKTTPSPPPSIETDNEQESEEDKPAAAEPEPIPIEESASPITPSTEPSRRSSSAFTPRPIQSKKDFLERLERRRKLQQQNGYTVVPPTPTSTTEKPLGKATQQNARKTNPPKTPTPPTNRGSQKKTSSSGRYSNKRTTTVQTTPLPPVYNNEAIAEESNVATQSSKLRIHPKSRRTSTS